MIKPILSKILSLFNPNDRFLVLEIFQNYLRGTLVKFDLFAKELKVLKVLFAEENNEALLKKFINQFGRLSKSRIVLGLDSHQATTLYGSTVVIRDNFKTPIDEADLDNLISQAIWKFFDRQRSRVAAKMNVNELDLVLSDVKIRGIKLDGYKVINPVGFKAKSVEVQFSQTFLSRDSLAKIKNFFPEDRVVFISESGTTFSHVVGQSTTEPSFLLANIFFDRTAIFVADAAQRFYLDDFGWGLRNLIISLSGDLAVDGGAARAIIGRYLTDDMSPNFKKRLGQFFLKELHILANGLSLASRKNESKKIYLNPFFEIPGIFSPTFKSKFEHAVDLEPIHNDLISKNFGFQIKFKSGLEAKNIFGALALLMEWHLSSNEDKMSQIAKRRVRWLSIH